MRLFVLAAAAAILAGATAANADLINAAGFYQEGQSKGCNGLSTCEVAFSPVPAGKTLIIRDVGCEIAISKATAVWRTDLSGRDAAGVVIQRSVFPHLDLMGTGVDFKRYQAQSETLHVLKAGQKPSVFIGAMASAATFIVDCTIGGELK